MRLSVRHLCSPLLLVAALPAQEIDFDALDGRLRFQLGPAGRLEMAPDPSRGDSDLQFFTPLVTADFRDTLANAGTIGWLALAYHGGDDIASLADGRAILGRLGRADDQGLLRTLENDAEAWSERLLRLLAVRVAEERRLALALPALERLGGAATDPYLRQAAREAVATLRDRPATTATPDLPALSEVLAKAPATADLVLVVDHHRLHGARPLLRWARQVGIAVTKREVHRAGGTVSLARWAGAVKLAEGIAALPYEVARQFGNHRLHRTVAGITLPRGAGMAGWVYIDGAFDVVRLRMGLRTRGLDPGDAAEQVRATLPGGSLAVTPRSATLRFAVAGDNTLGAQRAAELAQTLSAPISLHLRDPANLPMVPPGLQSFGVPNGIGIWPPEPGRDELRIAISCESERTAQAIAAQAEGLPRMLEMQLDGVSETLAKAVEPLLELLDGVEVVVEGTRAIATVPLQGFDAEKLIADVCRALAAGE